MLGNRASHVKPHVRILARRKKRSFQQRGIRLANPPPRRGRLDLRHKKLSVRRQCALLGLARSGVYRAPAPSGEDDAAAMRRIDALCTEHSFYGSRRIAFTLRMNRKRAQQRMRLMGIEALGPKPRTSKPAPEHRIYPYLLRDLTIERPNRVWACDISVPILGVRPEARGFFLSRGVMDWSSRAVLSWRLSNTMDTSFCLEALEEALARFGRASTSSAGDLQHRPRRPVHEPGLHRSPRTDWASASRWTARSFPRQHFHRAVVALAEARGRLPQALC